MATNQLLWEVEMMGHTTADISDVSFVEKLAAALKELYLCAELEAVWASPKSETPLRERLSRFSPSQIREAFAAGGMGFLDPRAEAFSSGITFNKVRPRERKRFLESLGYRQNEVSLRTPSRFLENKGFQVRFLDFCQEMARVFNVNLLYVGHSAHSDRAYSTQLGLGAGLRDVYWLNIFGKPFLKIIGKQKLLGAPAYRTSTIGDNHVLVQVTPNFVDPRDPTFKTAAERVYKHIGSEFFVKKEREPKGITQSSGVINLFQFVKMAMEARKQFKNTDSKADVCPKFD